MTSNSNKVKNIEYTYPEENWYNMPTGRVKIKVRKHKVTKCKLNNDTKAR